MANVSTSTVAYATRQTTGQSVFIASDGVACVLWCDGTNQVIAYADNTYGSWTKVTHTTGLNMVLAGKFRAGTDNIDTVTGGTSNVRGNYTLLTRSGNTWTVGTRNGLSGTTAIGVTAQGSPCVYAGQDAQGRHWIAVPGATNTATTCYYSVANSPTTTGWTASGAVTQTSDLFTPAADQVGNYLVYIYWNGTALQWKRVDNSGGSVGTWTTAATIANLTGSPNASSAVKLRAISATKAVLTYSTGSGIYAQIYDVTGDSFGTATQLSSGANDRHPTIATDGANNAWVVWCSYVAANNFALVFKKYNGSSWDVGATTLVASGTNITYPNAGFGAKTLGVTYTQGTGSPYTVGWVTQVMGGSHTISGVSAALEGPGPITLYGSDDPNGTLATASNMATSTGGSEVSKASAFGGSSYYGEMYSQGGSPTTYASVQAPLGHGWVYAPGAGTFSAGNWSGSVAYSTNASGMSDDMTLRFYKYTPGVGYSSIGSINTTFTSSASRAVLTFAATAMPETTLTASDFVYVDLWPHDSTGLPSETWYVYVSSDATAGGVANDMQITTSLFTAAGGGGTQNIVSVSAALQATITKDAISPVSTALQATITKDTISPVSASVSLTFTKSAIGPVSVAVQALGIERPIVSVSTAVQALGIERPIVSVSSAVALTNSHTLVSVSTAVAQSGIERPIVSVSTSVSVSFTRPIVTVSSAVQALGVERPITTVSAVVQQTGIQRPIVSVSTSVAVTTSKSITTVSVSVGQLTTSKPITTVSASLLLTGQRDIISVSSALQALGVERPIISVSGAVGAGGISRNVVSVSAALKALGVERSIVSVSAVLQQLGIQRPMVSVSAALIFSGTRPIVSVSTALKATVARDVTTVSTALKALGVQRPITFVSGAIGQGGIERPLVSVSVALQALGIQRTITGVSSALQAFGVRRTITGVQATVVLTGNARSISSVSVALLQTVSHPVTGISTALQATVSRPIVAVSTSVTLRPSRPITSISGAVQAFGVQRNITGVLGAIGVAGLTRNVVGVRAALLVTGKAYRRIEIYSPKATMTLLSPHGTMEIVSPRGRVEIQED